MFYLDNAATTQPLDSVKDKVNEIMEHAWFNPSSLYYGGALVQKEIEDTRQIVAEKINAHTNEIYFTSGSAESNNWAIRGFVDKHGIESVIITTPIEHSSILRLIKSPCLGVEKYICDVYNDGGVNFTDLENYLFKNQNKNILVSIIMANNEIGTIQDIKTISKIVHKYNGVLHTDATQAFCHIPIDVEDMGIDMLSASGQKIGGLKGTGILYIKDNITISPLIYGEQEGGMRGGTENVVGIVALQQAVLLSRYDDKELKNKRDYFISELSDITKLNGSYVNRLYNNINVTFEDNINITGEALLYMMDISNIYISTGSACNSKNIQPSHVLKAIGLSDVDASKTIRISINNNITYKDIDYVINEIRKGIKVLS